MDAGKFSRALRRRKHQSLHFRHVLLDQRKIHLRDKITRGDKSGIKTAGLERAAEKQSGREEQHQRQSNLRHH